jgi:hypothetical protein
MAFIKVLKFVNGIAQQVNTSVDSVEALSFKVGGPSGTVLTKAILDTLTGGSSTDATSLHSHDSRYYTKGQFINASTGMSDAAKPVLTDARGKFNPSFYQQNDIVHGNLSGLTSDDHPQYHNDTRGDARYYRQIQFIASSSGAPDASKPIKTNASGKLDPTFLDITASQHNDLAGIQGGSPTERYHLALAQHTSLTGGTAQDATSLHSHDSRYYTKVQVDAALALKANDNIVIKKDGSVPFTADQSMGGNKLTNLADAITSGDATNKGQLDTGLALKVSRAGDTLSGVLNMGGNKITNLDVPMNASDAATKGYVDAAQAGLLIKSPVRAATVADIPLSGLQTIDGIVLQPGDRVLVKDQTLASENGIYDVSSGSWVRSSDADSDSEVKDGTYVWVDQGATWADTSWVLVTNNPIVLGTTDLEFRRYSGAGQITAGIGLSKTGDTFDVNLGAGIKEQPTDEIGLDLHANGALELIDPSTEATSSANDSQLAVKLDGGTLTRGSSGLRITDSGVGPTQLAATVAGDGLSGGAGAPLAINPGDGIQVVSDAVSTKVSDLAGVGLEDDGANNLRLKASVAGSGLSINTSTGVIDVNVDGSSLEIATDTLQVKDGGISRPKIAPDAVGESEIDFGTGAGQVSAADLPIADPANKFSSSDVEGALAELAEVGYIESFISGEAIGQGDLVAARRDALNNLRLYRASAAVADNAVAATLTLGDVNMTTVNDFTRSGNDIRVRFLDPAAPNSALSVSVTGRDITVHLATNASSAITSTAQDIVNAINTTPASNNLISASTTNGAAIQSAYPFTSLSGGIDYNDNGRWKVIGMALDAATSAEISFRVKKMGRLACAFVTAPTAIDIGKSVYLSINRGKAQVYSSPSGLGEGIVYLGELVSAAEIEFCKQGILRGVNG